MTDPKSYSLETWHALIDADPIGTFSKLAALLDLQTSTADLVLADLEGDYRAACHYLLGKYKGLNQPSPPLTPPAKSARVDIFSVIGIVAACFFLLIVYGIIKDLFILPVFFSSPAPTQPAPVVISKPPTSTPRPRPTPTDSCLHWSQVSTRMEGQTLCIYGDIHSVYETEDSWTRIKFSNLSNTFFLEDTYYLYPDLRPGDCVQATGAIRLYNRIPYMQLEGELYTCP